MQTANRLSDLFNKVVNETFTEFADKNLQPNDLAMTLIDLTDFASKKSNTKIANNQTNNKVFDYRGGEAIYPASIVKLFYLVATHKWLEEKKIVETAELKRAYKDMIIESSNDATNYVIDVITDTTSGPELSETEMAIWSKKRNTVNDYFKTLGYENINVNQKVWGDGSYGRDRIFVGEKFEFRNKLTTNATARLLSEIATGKCINAERSEAMLQLLARDFSKASDDIDNQATGFMGACLPKTAKLWSKAGWMNTARHDAAYIELASGIRFVLVVFISHHAKEYWMLPTIANKVIKTLEVFYSK